MESFNVSIVSIQYNGISWIALNSTRPIVFYSINGITWYNSSNAESTVVDPGAFQVGASGIVTNGSDWIVGLQNTQTGSLISKDGINTWVSNGYAGYMTPFTYNGSIYIVEAQNQGQPAFIIYSYNGLTWLPATSLETFFGSRIRNIVSQNVLGLPKIPKGEQGDTGPPGSGYTTYIGEVTLNGSGLAYVSFQTPYTSTSYRVFVNYLGNGTGGTLIPMYVTITSTTAFTILGGTADLPVCWMTVGT
jgi:hypothetical protein